jgi:hypothetical protein
MRGSTPSGAREIARDEARSFEDELIQPPARRVTQPQRRFNRAALATLRRADRRKLCQLLLTEGGARVVETHQPAAYDEFVLETTPLWRSRRVRVRVATREVVESDVAGLSARVVEAGDADALLIAPFGVAHSVASTERIPVLGPDDLIARLERSPSIEWSSGTPRPAYERATAIRGLNRDAALLDPVGLRWLPVLALNEVPPDLASAGGSPQDLLERYAFRVLTATFQFGGSRLGESRRGERLADSLITWTKEDGDAVAALVDCKASADGYVMNADHERRFRTYVEDTRADVERDGINLAYLLIISSSFPGAPSRHPYGPRARALRESVDVGLVYLRAIDLARLGVAVEARELPPAGRRAMHWSAVFDRGIVSASDLESLVIGRT